MTISSTTRTAGPYAGTGVQQIFSFAFKVFVNTDMLVVQTNNATGNVTVMNLTSDYTVSLNADQNANPGGTITMSAAPAVGISLSITSQVPLLQPTDIANVGNFYPKAVTDAFDRATIQIQQQSGLVGSTVRGTLGEVLTSLPPAATRAGMVLAFDSLGQPVLLVPPSGSGTALAIALADTISPSNGVALVGRAAAAVNTVIPVNGVVAMLALPTTSISPLAVRLRSYYPAALPGSPAYGGGFFYWDSTCPKSSHNGGTIISNTVPWTGAQGTIPAFLAGTGETLPAGFGCWVRYAQKVDITMFGAVPVGGYNNIDSIQKALDTSGVVGVPIGTFSFTGTIKFNNDGANLVGDNMKLSVLNCLNTSLPAIQNPLKATVTRLFCGIQNLQITASAIGGNTVVDWSSIQFGVISKVWILGQSVGGCTLINMAAVWTVTEATYNVVADCYFGLCSTGISISDGANNNNILRNRFQPSFSGGIGVFLSATVAGRVSVIGIKGNGFEFPGQISTGINVLQNCDSVHIHDNRFESMLNGIVVGATGNKNITGISRSDNYFSSCTTSLNLSGGAVEAKGGIVAAGSFLGSTGAAVGQPFGMTLSRSAVGIYVATYTDATYPDSSQAIMATVTTSKFALAPTSTGFTITCQTDAGVNTDSAFVNLIVVYNR